MEDYVVIIIIHLMKKTKFDGMAAQVLIILQKKILNYTPRSNTMGCKVNTEWTSKILLFSFSWILNDSAVLLG